MDRKAHMFHYYKGSQCLSKQCLLKLYLLYLYSRIIQCRIIYQDNNCIHQLYDFHNTWLDRQQHTIIYHKLRIYHLCNENKELQFRSEKQNKLQKKCNLFKHLSIYHNQRLQKRMFNINENYRYNLHPRNYLHKNLWMNFHILMNPLQSNQRHNHSYHSSYNKQLHKYCISYELSKQCNAALE